MKPQLLKEIFAMKKSNSRGPARRKQSTSNGGGDRTNRKNKSPETWIPGIKDTDLKKVLKTTAKLGPDAFLSSSKRKGKSPIIFLRPPAVRAAPPQQTDAAARGAEAAPPADPCDGINFVDFPDIAAQLNLAPLGQKNCPSESDKRRIEQAVLAKVSRFRLPDPEVRAFCSGLVLTVGIWPSRASAGSCTEKARDLALRNIALLVRENKRTDFGFFLSAGLITRLAAEGFAVASKRLSSNGQPDPFGPIHLTGLLVVLQPNNRIDTFVNGFDDRPTPDVRFTLTLSDTIADDAGCFSTSSKNVSRLDKALAGLLAFLTVTSTGPLGLPLGFYVIFNDLDAVLNQPDGPENGGVGNKILQSVPQEIPLPNKAKLLLIYKRTDVTVGGLFFGAAIFPGARQPTARIVGPTRLVVHEDKRETQAVYRVEINDTFGNVTFIWSSTGNIIDSPNGQGTRVHFPRGKRKAGETFQRTLNVAVADEDGPPLNVAPLTVTITVVEADELPPVCRVKPFLDICQPVEPIG
jgi:hypothetical protein